MKRKTGEKTVSGYDYLTKEARENTAAALFEKAKRARTVKESEWERHNDYYNFVHDVSCEVKDYCAENNLPWKPAVCPDPWIMVESQIDPNVPEPQFHGRDDDRDSERARKREFAVKYIVENNDLTHKNTANERRLLKYGDAFWKGYFDIEMRCGTHEGDIAVKDISPEDIFPDPATKDLQAGQYVAYVYTMHKVKFCQVYRRELENRGIEPDEILSGDYVPRQSIFDMTSAFDELDDTVQILEFWFKWPFDTEVNGEKVGAGQVGCTIQAGGMELKLIPNYWKKTGKQCKLFPFVHYWRIRDENEFWNKSELYPIMDLVDAKDRKLSSALLNDAMMANDIIIAEEDSFADGCEPVNEPGARWTAKKNKGNSIKRLGGLQTAANDTAFLGYLKDEIERTNRNFDINQGREVSRQTTATGLALLQENSNTQSDIKKADRLAGFERLYQLLDWLALEFFDDNRLIYLGADKEKNREEAESINYNSDEFTQHMEPVADMNGDIVREAWDYYPKVDVTITAGDSVVKSKEATMNALSALIQSNVTADNWKLYKAQLDILDIPGKQEIIDDWEKKFGAGIPAEVIQALQADPQLLASVEQIAMQQTQPAAQPTGGLPI